MANVGFIGLGIMGLPMARNVVRSGNQVLGYNRSPDRTQELARHGGAAAASLKDLVQGSEVIITMLPDSPDVEAVVLSEGGVLTHCRPGQTLIDMSSIRPEVARRIAGEAFAHGVHVLDAPVSGGEKGAIDGTLSIMVGGEREVFETQRGLLEMVGRTVVHVGPHGAGQTVKAANQLIVAGNIQLVAEALTLLEALEVDLEAAVRVLGGGLAGSRVLEMKSGPMIRRDFTPGFRSELHHKDLGIVTEAARHAGVVLPLGAIMGQLMGALVATGHGSEDHSALVRLVRELSGRE